jgi:hypothetical protein
MGLPLQVTQLLQPAALVADRTLGQANAMSLFRAYSAAQAHYKTLESSRTERAANTALLREHLGYAAGSRYVGRATLRAELTKKPARTVEPSGRKSTRKRGRMHSEGVEPSTYRLRVCCSAS